MIKTKKVLLNMETGLYYCGTYWGEIWWDDDVGMSTDIDDVTCDFYPWEIDQLAVLPLEVKEIVEYFYE